MSLRYVIFQTLDGSKFVWVIDLYDYLRYLNQSSITSETGKSFRARRQQPEYDAVCRRTLHLRKAH